MLPTGKSATSAQALQSISVRQLKNKQDRVFDICLAAQRHGIGDLSGKEIQQQYELVHGERIDASSISARVNALVTAKRLERVRMTRPCCVTGRDIHPVRVPMMQARLVA